MQRKTLASLITAAACAVLAFTASTARAQNSDPSGTWTWSQPARNGGTPRVSTLKLKLDGDKLTGTVSMPGRGGGAAPAPAKIEDGKVKGDQVSFTVTREFNNNKIVSKYSGKLSGDTIKGKVETERNGEAGPSRDWEAKRSTDTTSK
jgi:hypothetical protein